MWRFVQLTDPHLASRRDGEWNNGFLCTMMPDVMACLRRDLAALAPEFILATGDICSHQTRAAMFEARDLMESLGIPYYPMGGNHDFVLEDSRDWFAEAFGARLPGGKPFYSFDWKQLHFTVLDPWWLWSDGTLHPLSERVASDEFDMTLRARWAVPPDQLEWLEADLEAHADRPALVASHYPAMRVPARMQRPGYRDSGALDNGELLIEVLERHPNVRAIFSGHMHMHYVETIGHVTHIVTGSLPEYPTEYRDIQVFEDRLEVRTLGLSDPSFAARSLIPGKDWTKGEACDRAFTVELGF